MKWRGWEVFVGINGCIRGDFNVVREVREKLNSSSITRSMKIFDELIK